MKKNIQSSTKGNAATPTFGLDGHPLIEWITMHGEVLLYILLGAFLSLFVLYLWFAGGSAQAEKDFLLANEQFYVFQQSDENASDTQTQQAALSMLTQVLQKHPDLQSKYDARIAQILLDRNDIDHAKPFADAALRRVSKDNLPFYIDYAQVTLLMAADKYDEAIKRSITLKGQMLKDFEQADGQEATRSFGEFLFAFNMLRTAFMQQHVGAKADELNSWEEWKSFTSSSNAVSLAPNIDRKPFFSVAQLFTDGPVSLDQYIDMRLQTLASLQEKS